MKPQHTIWVCHNEQLADGEYLRIEVAYAKTPSSVIVFRHQDNYLAYRNLCVHMPRTLDCEQNTIFDESGQKLRCSMHGIQYDPVTGESLSTMCNGEKLTPVKLIKNEKGIWICDKRVKPLTEATQGLD